MSDHQSKRLAVCHIDWLPTMNECLSTFPVGLEEPVKSALTETLNEPQFSLTLNGLAVYRTSSPLTLLKRLPFVNNTFVLLRRFDGPSARQPTQIMREALASPDLERQQWVRDVGEIRFPRIP